jgi:CheY-like chemotaxis protein/AraC-like DNA-binding protein
VLAGLSPRRVLLAVDDDRGVLDAYRAIFDDGYELLTAIDGRAALYLIERRVIDVALLDVMMPGASGFAVLDAMQLLSRRPKVVVVSAVNDARAALTALRLGAHDYVTKPFDTDELELVVRCLAEGQALPIRQTDALAPTPPHVLIVSRHVGFRASLAVVLRARCRVDAVPGTQAATGILAHALPDAAVVDTAPNRYDERPLIHMRERYPAAQIIAVDSRSLPDLGRVLDETVDVLAPRHRGLRHFADPVPKVVACVAEQYPRLRVATVAEDLGLSSRHLARVFVEQMGMGVKDYITRVRIEAAKYLLRETPEKTDAVAELVGLCDASHLARIFRGHGSDTPASYRL